MDKMMSQRMMEKMMSQGDGVDVRQLLHITRSGRLAELGNAASFINSH